MNDVKSFRIKFTIGLYSNKILMARFKYTLNGAF